MIRGRLMPEVGAVVQRALEAASDWLFRDSQELPKAEDLAQEVTPAQRRADALGCWPRGRYRRTWTEVPPATAIR